MQTEANPRGGKGRGGLGYPSFWGDIPRLLVLVLVLVLSSHPSECPGRDLTLCEGMSGLAASDCLLLRWCWPWPWIAQKSNTSVWALASWSHGDSEGDTGGLCSLGIQPPSWTALGLLQRIEITLFLLQVFWWKSQVWDLALTFFHPFLPVK